MVQKKVLIGMSGGVDSSMSAQLLKEQGYDLIGVTLRVFKSDRYRIDSLSQNIKDASILADKLKIPYFVIDVSQDFEKVVVNNFISEYQAGRTPNPCALCNPEIKWKYLLDIADEFDCEFIATGHYSQINVLDGRYYITKATDESKDQSFFLWRLSQEALKRTLFPLGLFIKSDIKNLATLNGYKNLASKRESYNICFIPDGDYRNYIQMNSTSENQIECGDFVTDSGKIIGNHQGVENYTIGQRNGLKVSEKGDWYVVNILSDKNIIVLGNKNALLHNELVLKEINFSKYEIIPDNIIVNAKLNYRGDAIQCKIHQDNDLIRVQFMRPAFAISPGQSIAFYEDNDLIGGGIIT